MDNKKILIIEDEEILIDVLQKRIKQEGYEVFLARDGEEGIEKIRQIKPDLILLDIIMPKKNGFEVLTEMRQDKTIADIPVIIISNSGQPVEIDRVLQLGVKDYLIKTQFDPAEVLEKINKQFNLENLPVKKEAPEIKIKEVEPKKKNKLNQVIKSSSHQVILIVEDDIFLRNLIIKKLTMADLATIAASNGTEGLKMAEEKKPDLILLDLMLPSMDGFEVLRRIKNNSETAKIPVIILSNLGQKEDVTRGLGLGAVDFLIKAHFTPKEIINKVKAYLPK